MPSTVYLVTGGARSGKSGYAQRLCESLCKEPIYLATSKPFDDDFRERIKKHQDDRGPEWTTIEEPLTPSVHAEQFSGKAIMVDCLTLWLTNHMMEEGAFTEPTEGEDAKAGSDTKAADRALEAIKKEFDAVTQKWDATFVFVTNEIGSGTHAENNMSRKFVDAQGWLNQHVGARAERVIHMVCGVPNMIKEPGTDRRHPLKIPDKEAVDEAKMVDKFLSSRGGFTMDAKGYFLVKLDRERGVITAPFVSCILNDKGEVCDLEGNKISCCDKTKRPEPMRVFEGRTAKELTVEIFERWSPAKDILSVGHAAYIGREAQRAEHCLYSGEHYQQD